MAFKAKNLADRVINTMPKSFTVKKPVVAKTTLAAPVAPRGDMHKSFFKGAK
jgi:hypothetical protein